MHYKDKKFLKRIVESEGKCDFDECHQCPVEKWCEVEIKPTDSKSHEQFMKNSKKLVKKCKELLMSEDGWFSKRINGMYKE